MKLHSEELRLLEQHWDEQGKALRREKLARFLPIAKKKPKSSKLPDRWNDFLKERYQGGQKRVPNPNPKTRHKYETVTVQTACNFEPYRKKILQEYHQWLKKDSEREFTFDTYALPPKRFETVSIKTHDEFNAMREKLNLSDLSDKDIADLSGFSGIPGMTSITITPVWIDTEEGPHFSISGKGKHLRDFERMLYRDKKGNLVVYNDLLFVEPESNPPKGLGTRMLAHQVSACLKAGVARIDCFAFTEEDRDAVGHYVWPLMGFNSDGIPYYKKDGFAEEGIPKESLDDASLTVPLSVEREGSKLIPKGDRKQSIAQYFKEQYGRELKSVRDFMLDPVLRYWWFTHGASFDASFSLKKGSESLAFFNSYLKKKGDVRGFLDG